MGMNFAIIEESYSGFHKWDTIRKIWWKLRLNSGTIVVDNYKAEYLVFDDVFDPNIWQNIG